jgi:hypothetical protein
MRRNPILVPKFWTIHDFIHQSVDRSIQRLGEKVVNPHTGMDHIVFREKALSEEEDRPPQYHSSAVRDEVSDSICLSVILFTHTDFTTGLWISPFWESYYQDNSILVCQTTSRQSDCSVKSQTSPEGKLPVCCARRTCSNRNGNSGYFGALSRCNN